MEELVKYIVEHLVTDKSQVKVSTIESGERDVTIRVEVAEEDKGKVIGKNGRIAQSLRAIVKSASNETGKRYFVTIG